IDHLFYENFEAFKYGPHGILGMGLGRVQFLEGMLKRGANRGVFCVSKTTQGGNTIALEFFVNEIMNPALVVQRIIHVFFF
ncbi:hypothetical protein HZA43_01155, partial [Candidatus Peregrinibacteria bacterium]|nr:hypothetical protein [Candidatus Peregrinibacteria bacterium]